MAKFQGNHGAEETDREKQRRSQNQSKMGRDETVRERERQTQREKDIKEGEIPKRERERGLKERGRKRERGYGKEREWNREIGERLQERKIELRGIEHIYLWVMLGYYKPLYQSHSK